MLRFRDDTATEPVNTSTTCKFKTVLKSKRSYANDRAIAPVCFAMGTVCGRGHRGEIRGECLRFTEAHTKLNAFPFYEKIFDS